MPDLTLKLPELQSVHALAQGCPGENPLAPHYQDFQVGSRVLLTGHSHQAWPDCAKQGVLAAFQDAARHVDDKWDLALQKAQRVREGFAQRLDDPKGAYALGQNVHELFVRCFSALPRYQDAKALQRPAPVLCSSGEFHSLRRQLDRWQEYGLLLEAHPHTPKIAKALAAALYAKPAGHYGAVVLSAVSFMQGLWVSDLATLAQAAREQETPLIIDAYHAVNVSTFSVQALDLEDAFILGGGYKYCQLGEGVCFLRIPERYRGRPGVTGWFAEFELRDQVQEPGQKVNYPPGPGALAGSTYDPTSHYRAAVVFDFFDALELTPQRLTDINQRQLHRLESQILALKHPHERICLAHEGPEFRRSGFLALKSPWAQALAKQLRGYQVFADARQDILRLGPAPYLRDAQLDESIIALDKCLRQLG